MTIDSDSEVEEKQRANAGKKFKPTKAAKEEDEIQLSHSVILQDTDDVPRNKHTKGHIVGSNNLWNFADSLQIDRRANIDDDGGATTADEKAPFK